MKLELKHISAYLPYKLKVSVNHNEYIVTIDDEMDSDSICLTDVIENGHKLLLRPLSDLTKEIEVNGESFIPLNKLSWTQNKHKLFMDLYESKIIDIPYNAIEKLFEWHFDVFGLIDQGLAIDINTLKQ